LIIDIIITGTYWSEAVSTFAEQGRRGSPKGKDKKAINNRQQVSSLPHARSVSAQGEYMFEQTMLGNANSGRRAWTTGLGFAGEAALVAFFALVPMIWPEVLPKPQALLLLLTPPAPVPPPTDVVVKPRATHAPSTPMGLIMPTSVPVSIANVVDEPPAVVGAVPGFGQAAGDPHGLIERILTTSSVVTRPPVTVNQHETEARTESTEPRRVRTSSIELARVIHRVEPVYPPVARMAHVSGTVELTGVIGTDGRIRELKALGGNPLLVKAAIDAVSQWIYAPPILNPSFAVKGIGDK
jgi:protein TonB